jgi:flagellar basal-body rod modification protein FlgD
MTTTDAITTPPPAQGISGITGAAKPTETAALQGLDKDAFLKLLVAQLRYQNPMSPMDGQEYLAQAAQFAAVERLEGLAQAQSEMVAYQKVLISSTLVGKHVKGVGELGDAVEGTVRSVSFAGGAAVLDVDGSKVALDAVTEVTPAASEPQQTATEASEEKTEATEGRTDSTQEEAAQ